VAALALATITLAASCSSDRGSHPGAAASPESTSTTTSTAPEAATTDPPATDKRIGMTQPAWYQDEYDLPAARRAFPQIAAAGARWVVLTPTWYQRNRTTALPRFDREKTVSDDGVRHAIADAKAAGLHVVLKPHVDLDDDTDRAEIRPRDPDAWFAAYTGLVQHYAALATDSKADELVVGTELAGTSKAEARWRPVIAAARATFPGPLTYAANYDEYQQIGFWDALDAIGIDAYFPLASHGTADVDALVAAWRPIVDRLGQAAAAAGKPVLFTAAGYPSQRGSVVAPYDWERSRTPADDEQAAAYEALFRALWPQPWFLGVYWWMWDDLPGRSSDDQRLDYTPHGKPAEDVLRRWAQDGGA
jgi:hypothetical protein